VGHPTGPQITKGGCDRSAGAFTPALGGTADKSIDVLMGKEPILRAPLPACAHPYSAAARRDDDASRDVLASLLCRIRSCQVAPMQFLTG